MEGLGVFQCGKDSCEDFIIKERAHESFTYFVPFIDGVYVEVKIRMMLCICDNTISLDDRACLSI